MRLLRFSLGLVALATTLGCDPASGLLSEQERRSIYSVNLRAAGDVLPSGGAAVAGSVITPSLELVSGAADPAELSLRLVDASGAERAQLRYLTSAAARGLEPDAGDQGVVVVDTLAGVLPPFSLPEDLVPGEYRLAAMVYRRDGLEASRTETRFFCAPPGFGIEKVDVFPPDPSPGSAVLLLAHIRLGGGMDSPRAPAVPGSTSMTGTGTTKDLSRDLAPSPDPAGEAPPAEGTGTGGAAAAPEAPGSGATSSPTIGATSSTTTSTTASTTTSTTTTLPGGASNPGDTSGDSHREAGATGSTPQPPARDLALTPGFDPWIRWSVAGETIAEGRLSGLFDRVVWRAPSTAGVFGILVELFPAMPDPGEAPALSPWRREARIVVKDGTALPDEPFRDQRRFVALMRLEGDFTDLADTAAETARVTGAPELSAFPGGFGYFLGNSSTITWPGRSLPASSDTVEPFSVLLRLSIAGRDGTLLALVEPGTGRALEVGLSGGYPYVDLLKDGVPIQRSTAGIAAEEGFLELQVSFVPAARGELELVWTLDGRRWRGDRFPVAALPRSIDIALGGRAALPAIFQTVAISADGSAGPPRLLAAALGRALGPALNLAWGFESALSPDEALIAGNVSFGSLLARLAPEARIRSLAALPLAEPLSIEADMGAGGLLELYDPDGALLAAIDARGMVSGAAGQALGPLPGFSARSPAGRLSFTLRALPRALEVGVPGFRSGLLIPFAESCSLGFRNPAAEGGGPFTVERLVARRLSR